MSTLVDFVPTAEAVFQFQPTLKGVQYLVSCPWNAFGERWYISVSDLSGNIILHRPIVQSGPRFQAVLTWVDGLVTAVLNAAHSVSIGALVNGRVSDTDTPFDGQYEMLATRAQTLTFDLAVNPQEPVAVTGDLDFPLNLLAGYGIGSLYYHPSSAQFEY